MGRHIYCLFLIFVVLAASAADAAKAALVGGWSPIENLEDPHVVEIGKYAVSEYNKRSKAELKFEKVVSGETQVVAGMNYRLVVLAEDGGGKKSKYEAVVWEKPWEKFMNLTSFKPFKG